MLQAVTKKSRKTEWSNQLFAPVGMEGRKQRKGEREEKGNKAGDGERRERRGRWGGKKEGRKEEERMQRMSLGLDGRGPGRGAGWKGY